VKLSLPGEYALHALVVLGLNYDQRDAVVRIQTISEQQNIPKRFLEQILNDLRSGGILESRRGVSGGYRLRRPPELITLAEVSRRIEGPLAPIRCVSELFYKPCSCPDEARCGVRSVMKDVRDAIAKILESVTVAELCRRVREFQSHPAHPSDYVI
jgi:Rrf2 family transcriptional regulator, cysteine metabolism repressor